MQKFHTHDVPLSSFWVVLLWSDEANFQSIRSTTQIWLVECHQYGISLFIPQKSFCKETSNGVAKWQLHFQAKYVFKMQSAHYFPSLIALSLAANWHVVRRPLLRLKQDWMYGMLTTAKQRGHCMSTMY